MSFTGSLVLSGIGGLVFKYGGQQSEKEKSIPSGFRDLTVGFFENRIQALRERFEMLTLNFWKELVETRAYQYPIRVFIPDTLENSR